jgi:hypothetical protein
MKDITSAKLMYFKAILFFIGGLIASLIILIDHPSLKVAALLGISVWCFARAYYFVFYVIEHYIDSNYKFAGLSSFLVYIWQKRKLKNRGIK